MKSMYRRYKSRIQSEYFILQIITLHEVTFHIVLLCVYTMRVWYVSIALKKLFMAQEFYLQHKSTLL